ncbi:helix-turn-helix domain-containing protein [Amycolatopsis sp. CA-126428]|uniref:helix-turn-helix domain-containing protein n=1 Tax=Amycolatopsis sp. CA-126428 TaxID=2073158 RepID=UPI00210095ED|nr:helix-turn-helix domain-containing protein [Amycolatopsis sp. CA-126428]
MSVDDLAVHAGMSRRNFTRRFAEVTGSTPARWVLARRLDEARHLLETTSTPIARVAAACGFASVVTFRRNFVSAYSTTPTRIGSVLRWRRGTAALREGRGRSTGRPDFTRKGFPVARREHDHGAEAGRSQRGSDEVPHPGQSSRRRK